MIEDIKYVNDLLGTTENQMTKDMIIGPHRKRTLGGKKKVNVGSQLRQLVDDTKVFKTQFKIKIQSHSGLRQWVQMVCRYRQAPGTENEDGTPNIHGNVLQPDEMAEITNVGTTTYDNYYQALPPVPRGTLQAAPDDNMWKIVKTTSGPGTANLFYLNLPLTYMEQDMYNMGMGPGKRNYTYPMGQGPGNPMNYSRENVGSGNAAVPKVDPVLDINDGVLMGQASQQAVGKYTGLYYDQAGDPDYTGIVRDRFTEMMPAVHPQPVTSTFPIEGGMKSKNDFASEFEYNFRKGWGIHMLDYAVTAKEKGTVNVEGTEEQPGIAEPQFLKTNNSVNTMATIKNGTVSYSMNNMGESQCYVTTLVVVNKHVDKTYWTMPEALTDSYLKAAQNFISSGEWSISNNITDTMATKGGVESTGDTLSAYMYVTHPSIKPFGKVPAKFLEDFNKHFAIKMATTTKLGIGERQSVQFNLGGLQYTAEQLAMQTTQKFGNVDDLPSDYFPVDYWGDSNTNFQAVFPQCCQQGTHHFLFGVQGMSLPYLSGDGTDVSKVEGRWAVPALVDIQGTYKEIIAPLTTVPKNKTPIQKCYTALPTSDMQPVVTTLPRVRTTANGLVPINLT